MTRDQAWATESARRYDDYVAGGRKGSVDALEAIRQPRE